MTRPRSIGSSGIGRGCYPAASRGVCAGSPSLDSTSAGADPGRVRTFSGVLRQACRFPLHAAMCLLCVLVLLVMAAAPRLHTTVCTGDCCVVHVQSKKQGCSGCCKDKAPTPPAERKPDEERHRAQCGPGCCVHIDVDVDPAPVPGTVARVQLPPAAVVPEPLQVESPRARWPRWTLPHDTGPPRIDSRTALRASTVLTL